jgi:hypothetical protein
LSGKMSGRQTGPANRFFAQPRYQQVSIPFVNPSISQTTWSLKAKPFCKSECLFFNHKMNKIF